MMNNCDFLSQQEIYNPCHKFSTQEIYSYEKVLLLTIYVYIHFSVWAKPKLLRCKNIINSDI